MREGNTKREADGSTEGRVQDKLKTLRAEMQDVGSNGTDDKKILKQTGLLRSELNGAVERNASGTNGKKQNIALHHAEEGKTTHDTDVLSHLDPLRAELRDVWTRMFNNSIVSEVRNGLSALRSEVREVRDAFELSTDNNTNGWANERELNALRAELHGIEKGEGNSANNQQVRDALDAVQDAVDREAKSAKGGHSLSHQESSANNQMNQQTETRSLEGHEAEADDTGGELIQGTLLALRKELHDFQDQGANNTKAIHEALSSLRSALHMQGKAVPPAARDKQCKAQLMRRLLLRRLLLPSPRR